MYSIFFLLSNQFSVIHDTPAQRSGQYHLQVEQKRMVKATQVLNLRPLQRRMVMGDNALRFMGMEDQING